jgi:hypothetical protein
MYCPLKFLHTYTPSILKFLVIRATNLVHFGTIIFEVAASEISKIRSPENHLLFSPHMQFLCFEYLNGYVLLT